MNGTTVVFEVNIIEVLESKRKYQNEIIGYFSISCIRAVPHFCTR